MKYEVKDVVCDYGVCDYGVYENGNLLYILNNKENALLIKDILESDFKKESYKKNKVIKNITKAMIEDCKKCEEQDWEGDCGSCYCSICIMD